MTHSHFKVSQVSKLYFIEKCEIKEILLLLNSCDSWFYVTQMSVRIVEKLKREVKIRSEINRRKIVITSLTSTYYNAATKNIIEGTIAKESYAEWWANEKAYLTLSASTYIFLDYLLCAQKWNFNNLKILLEFLSDPRAHATKEYLFKSRIKEQKKVQIA